MVQTQAGTAEPRCIPLGSEATVSRGGSRTLRLVVAMGLGAMTGVLLGKHAEALGEAGMLVIRLLKTLATPLVFVAIIDAFLKTEIPARRGVKLLVISLCNAVVAASIGLGLNHIIPINHWVDLASLRHAILGTAAPALPTTAAAPSDIAGILRGFVPSSLVEPFATNNIVAVVMLAVFFGAALRHIKASHQDQINSIENMVAMAMKVLTTILDWIIAIVPLAVFAVVAKVVGTSGFTVFKTLGAFALLIMAGLALHGLVYYPILLAVLGRSSPRRFFKGASEALVTAFGTGSSIATLPVTLRTLQGRLGVSEGSARLAACVGSNLNHDGILLYEAATALFVAQVMGISLNLSQQLGLALTSTLAAVGIAGVPEAGLITLSLVLGSLGLPLAAVPIIVPVDWFLGRLRAVTNVLSDMVVAVLLDRPVFARRK